MAEDTEHKEEPSPLSEEEVEALSEKFTASWEATDSAHAGPGGSDAAAPTGVPGRPNLKRTMLGMPTATPSFEAPAATANAETPGLVIDEEALPRQKTLLGMQAPDPVFVKKVAESFVVPGSQVVVPPSAEARAPTSLDPVAQEPAQQSQERGTDDVSQRAPSSVSSSIASAEPAVLSVDVEWPDDATPAPASPATATKPVPAAPIAAAPATTAGGAAPLGPAQQGPGLFGWGDAPGTLAKAASKPAGSITAPLGTTAPSTPASTTAPLGTTAPLSPASPPAAAATASAVGAPASSAPSTSAAVSTTTAPLGTTAPLPAPPTTAAPTTEAEPSTSAKALSTTAPLATSAPTPVQPAGSAGRVTVRMGSVTAPPAEETPAASSKPAAEPASTPSKPAEPHAVFPEESTLPTGMAPGKPLAPSPTPSAQQTYTPPVAPPPALGSSPTNEKTIVIEDESSRSPEDEARAAAQRLAQRADTLPPQRPRLEIEIPPELQRRPGKAGLWIAGGLSLLIGAGAVFALSSGAGSPELSAEKSADVRAVTPEPTPAKPTSVTEPTDEKAAADAALDAAASDTLEDASTESGSPPSEAGPTSTPAPIAAKPKAITAPTNRPVGTAAKKPTTPSKPTTTAPAKTTKVPKKPAKPTSKTIVRDAPF